MLIVAVSFAVTAPPDGTVNTTMPSWRIISLAQFTTELPGSGWSPGVNTKTRRLYGSATYRLVPSKASDVGVGVTSTAPVLSIAVLVIEIVWLETILVVKSGSPKTISALAALAVGMEL